MANDCQREELLTRVGDSHEIIGEYRNIANGSQGVESRPGLKKLLDDAAPHKFDVLLCTDRTRLPRHLTPEIIVAIREDGVKIVTMTACRRAN